MNVDLLLPPYPHGWYVVGFTDELDREQLITRKFMGQEIVLYRTGSGQICVIDPFCAHLGAHFGYGGKVEGELLRCPFHGFKYAADGACVATGYETPPPPKARLSHWCVQENAGLILVYYHEQRKPPDWEVPPVDTTGWTKLVHNEFILFDHPQETTENSVDIGHFAFIHGYTNVTQLGDLVTKGPFLSTAYSVRRSLPFVGSMLPNVDFGFKFETIIYGLGYSMVNVEIPEFHLEARLWVLPTPIDEKRLTLRMAVMSKNTKPGNVHPLLSVMPSGLFNNLVARFILDGFLRDAGQDFPIWQNKKYINPPALAKGDGPIGKYRAWAKQFYS
jgi:nitrite reductase/ring-hydroxylating ferredoxin subunit